MERPADSREIAGPSNAANDSSAAGIANAKRSEIANNLRRGQSEEAMGHPDQASQFYQRILRIDPSHQVAHERLAKIARLAGDLQRAERHWNAVAQNHGNGEAGSTAAFLRDAVELKDASSKSPSLPHLSRKLVGQTRAEWDEKKELRLAGLTRSESARRIENSGAALPPADGNLPLWTPDDRDETAR